MKLQFYYFFILILIIHYNVAALAKLKLEDTEVFKLPKQDLPQAFSYQEQLNYLPPNYFSVSMYRKPSWEEPRLDGTVQDKKMREFADHQLSLWWENTEFRNASMGRKVDQVEKKFHHEFYLNKNRLQRDHRIQMHFLAAQAVTKLRYTGWTRAEASVNFREGNSSLEVFENLDSKREIYIGHYQKTNNISNMIGLRWPW